MNRYATQYLHKIEDNSGQILHNEFCKIDQYPILKNDPYTFAISDINYKDGDIFVDKPGLERECPQSTNHLGFNDIQISHNDILGSHLDSRLQSTQSIASNGSHDFDLVNHITDNHNESSSICSLNYNSESNEQKHQKRKARSIRPSLQLSRTKTYLVVLWLKSNYEIDNRVSIPRSVLFSHYMHHCSMAQIDAVNPATFGKIIRIVFPDLKTRRLGVRGSSKYHHFGIKIRTYLSHHWLLQSSSFEDLDAIVQSMLTSLQIEQNRSQNFVRIVDNASGSIVSSFTKNSFAALSNDIHDLIIPIDMERLKRRMILLGKMYDYRFGDIELCQRSDHEVAICTDPRHVNRTQTSTVTIVPESHAQEKNHKDNMSTMLNIFKEFTFPLIYSAKHGFLTTGSTIGLDPLYNEISPGHRGGHLSDFMIHYQHHMAELFSFFVNMDDQLIEASIKCFWDDTCKNIIRLVPDQEFLVRLVIIVDDIFYQALYRSLMPNMDPINQDTEAFGHKLINHYESWISNGMEWLPEAMLEAKLEHARNICHLMKRRHTLHVLAISIKNNFSVLECIQQMSKDWMSLDFGKIQQQAGWACSCYPDLISQVQYTFCELLKINNHPSVIMESLINLATTLTDQFVPSQDKNTLFICFGCYKRKYLDEFNRYSTNVLDSHHDNPAHLRDHLTTINKTLPRFELSEDTIQNQQQLLLQNQQIHAIQAYIEHYRTIDTASRQFLYRWSSLSTHLLKELSNYHGSIMSMNVFYLLRSFMEDYVTHLVELRVADARRPLLYLLPNISTILCKTRCNTFATLAQECKKFGARMSSIITNFKPNSNIYCEKDKQGSNDCQNQPISLTIPMHTSSNSNSGLSPNTPMVPYGANSVFIFPTTNVSHDDMISINDSDISSTNTRVQQYSTYYHQQQIPGLSTSPNHVPLYSANNRTNIDSNAYDIHYQSIYANNKEYSIQSTQLYSQLPIQDDYLLLNPSDCPIPANITPPLYMHDPNIHDMG